MLTYIFVGLGAILLIIFLVLRDKNGSLLSVSFKTLTSITFIVTALVAMSQNENFDFAKYPYNVIAILIITGLLFGLFGDFTLDLKVYFKSLRDKYPTAQKDSDLMTFVGIIAFACGHIAYIPASIINYPSHTIILLYSALIAVVLSLIVVYGGKFIMKLEYGKFIYIGLFYCILLIWFGVLNLWIMILDINTSNILRFVGSITFLLSDLFLIITYFSPKEKYEIKGCLNPESRLMIVLNHGIYYVAQFCIALSLLYLI